MSLIPTQITFRGIPPSEALESDIRQRVEWLEQFHPGIVRCHVLVELPHRHHERGRRFHVRLEVTVPGNPPIVVSHQPVLHGGVKDAENQEHHKATETESVHRHARVAVHETFDAARRRLEDAWREQRGVVKTHEGQPRGEVVEISKVDGFGFIQAGENRIYFNRASVLDDAFDDLTVGATVAFLEEKGDKGPQASTVRVLRPGVAAH